MSPEASHFASAVEALKFAPTAFPKGKTVQKNLDTHYVDLEGLFRSLAHEGFGGTILMVFEEGSEALIVFREGTIITAYHFAKERLTGLDALSMALSLAKEHKAYVDVFKLEHEVLVALLPLLHGVQVHVEHEGIGIEEIVADFKKAEFTGALVAGENVPEMVGLIYGGVPMGWFDAQGTDHESGARPPSIKATRFRTFALDKADTFAAINLELEKTKVAARIREVMADEMRELGSVLYERSFSARKFEDERHVSKAGYRDLVGDIERAIATLRGPVVSRCISGELNGVVDTLIDVGF